MISEGFPFLLTSTTGKKQLTGASSFSSWGCPPEYPSFIDPFIGTDVKTSTRPSRSCPVSPVVGLTILIGTEA